MFDPSPKNEGVDALRDKRSFLFLHFHEGDDMWVRGKLYKQCAKLFGVTRRDEHRIHVVATENRFDYLRISDVQML
jgi:hypothetical protein